MVPPSLLFRLFTTNRQAQFRSTKILSSSFHNTAAYLSPNNNPTSSNAHAINEPASGYDENEHGLEDEESVESKALAAQAFDDAVADIMNNVKVKKPRTAKLPKIGEDGLPIKSDRKGQKVSSKKKPDHSTHAPTASARDDVKQYLRRANTASRRKSNAATPGDRRRMNIISEEACDAVLKRLKPSLQNHMGCDIIDINPGAGVWSSKLHDLLKPRTHILLEPEISHYGPLLEPLVSAPGSTYKLVPKSGLVWNHLEQVLSKEYLPHQTAWKAGDPRLEERNDTLLIVANLGYHPRKPFKGFSSLAQMVIYQLIGAIKAQSLVQKYGLARMLIWMDDEERHNVIPKALAAHRKPAIEADLVCEKLTEVASSTEEHTMRVREPHLNFRSLQAVLQRMHDNGIKIPKGRESVTAQELKRLDHEKTNPSKRLSPKAGMTVKQIRTINPQLGPKGIADYRWGGIITEFENMFQELKTLHDMPDSYNKRMRVDVLAKRRELWERSFKSTGSYGLEYVPYNCDSRLAFNREKPLLMWDRREYEPIRLHPEEFYPANPMALIDVQPKALHPILRKNFPQNYDILEYFLTAFLTKSAQSVTAAFNHLVPGAHDWLVANCPTLKDPRKGGNPNLDEMSVRLLTDEMILEMVDAWTRWPFRPSKYEILARMGAATHDTAVGTDMYNEDGEM